MPEAMLLNKQFEFVMPLQKSQSGMQDDGYYHIEFAISNTDPDLQGDQMTQKCLESMALQAKGLSIDGSDLKKSLESKGISIDDNHFEGLNAIIGPVTDSWVVKDVLWVDLRVRKEWESTIKDLIDSETQLGGSVQGHATEILEDDGSGIQKIDDVFLVKAALTDTPANWSTRGTARASTKTEKTCYGSMCRQIYKSLDIQKGLKFNLIKCSATSDEGEVMAKILDKSGVSKEDIKTKAKEHMDDEGNTTLKDSENFGGHGIDEADLKNLLGPKLGIDSNYSRPYVYEAYRKGWITDDDVTKAGYDPDKIKKSIGGDKIKKGILSVNDAFETVQAEINEALDKKYGTPNQWGGYNRDCYLQYTSPDSIFVSSDWSITSSDDLFTIPYTREDDGTGDMKVKLGDPVRADLQIVTKALLESEWMKKCTKKIGGGKLTKTENIPEGMDATFVDKIKGLGDDGKQFIKGILGFEDPEPTPTTDPKTPEPTQVGVQKGMISKEDVRKMIKEENDELVKKVDTLTEENESLKKTVNTSVEKDVKKTKKDLLTKSLELHKKLEPDMTPEEESDLVKEIKADLEKDIGIELVKRDIKTMTKSLDGIPAHETPFIGGQKQKTLVDKQEEEIKKIQKTLDDQGKVGV